jgi:DNA-binding MarR family transcriptional regulator
MTTAARGGMLGRMARTPTTDVRPGFREGLLLQVFVAGQLTGDLLRGELGPSMTGDRFAVLSVIGALGPITPGELARRLGMAPTTVSTWLARLERDGATSRRPNPVDRRSFLVEVTESGRAELRGAMPAFRRALESVREELGEDLDDVLSGLERLVGALRAAVAQTTTS